MPPRLLGAYPGAAQDGVDALFVAGARLEDQYQQLPSQTDASGNASSVFFTSAK